MAQRLLSISIGTTSAKLAEIKKSGKKIQVFSAYDIPISEGLCEDGIILDVDGLAAELKHYISKYKIKAKDLVFSITSKRIASKEVTIPFVKEKQISRIIEINAPEYFPVANIENYAMNYSILEIVSKDDGSQYRLNVTATPSDLLEGYELLAKAMKRKIEVIDYSGNAILQVLKSQTVLGQIDAILQLGYDNTVINIMNGSILIMQRSVANGLNALIASVCESIGLDEEDAVAFLEDNDILKIAGAYPDVKYIVDSVTSSIGRIFDFYNGRFPGSPVTEVKFIGDATFVNGIGGALENGLGMSTEEIFTLNNIQVKSRKITAEHATNFMANIGAIISPMNLKYKPPVAEGETAKEERLPWRLVVLSVIASLALGGFSVTSYFMTKNERDSLKSQLDSLANMKNLESQLEEANSKNQIIQDLLLSTKGPNDSLLTLINDLEKIMPIGMSIDSFSMADGTVTLSLGGHGKEGVARFIEEVKALKYVDSVKVDYVSEVIEGIDKYDVFNMTFKLKNIDDGDLAVEATDVDGEATNELPTDATEIN